MTIDNVRFGDYKIFSPQQKQETSTQLVQKQPKETSTKVVKGTAVAAGVGAGVIGAGEFIAQSVVLNNPKKYIELVENGIANCKTLEKAVTVDGKHISYAKEISKCEKFLDFVKKGKYDFKTIGKYAGIGPLVVGGTYLAYRGIKSLFTSKS